MMRSPLRDAADSAAATAPSTRHRWLPRGREGLRYRLGVASRAVAAIVGGYAVSALAGLACALWLPASSGEAVLIGTLSSFAVYACLALWVFAVGTAWRAWSGLALLAGALGVLILLRWPGSVG